jgi:glycosyltransferase involved in cell wall biosynthesis
MKILHVWDQAGVACILAKHHRRMGHEVRILKRSSYDPFGISQFYGEPLFDMDGKAFLKYAIKEAAGYDVIHIHTLYKIVPDLRKKYRDKKLMLHYHGSEARDRRDDTLKAEAESKADTILGSTADLKDFVDSIVYVPNPVDTEHFARDTRPNDRAFTIRTTRGDTQRVLDYLKSNGINMQVHVVDRETNPIPYAQVPAFLKQYGIYVDIKYIDGVLLHAMSKTGLESLACGLSVLDHELKYVEGLPEEHKPEVVANRMIDIYRAAG